MKLYLKYFKKFWLNFLIIVLLVAGQVSVSLTIPKYMAKMINVGIQQKGIENFVYSRLDEKLYQQFFNLATDLQQELLKNSYQLNDGFYNLVKTSKELESFTLTVNNILFNYQKENIDINNLDNQKKIELHSKFKIEKLDTQTKITQAHLIYKVNLENGLSDASVAYVKSKGFEMLLVAISGLIFVVLASFSSSFFATRVAKDLRTKIFSKVESFSDQEFNSFSTSSLITRTVGDTTKIQQLLNFCVRFIILSPLTAIGAIIQSSSTSKQLLWILVVVIVSMISTILYIVIKVSPSFIKMQKLLDRISLVIRENLSGLRVIRAFNTQDIQTKRFSEVNSDFKNTYENVSKTMALINPLMIFAMNMSAVAIVYFGSNLINLGNLELGSLLAFIQFASQVIFSFMLAGMLFFTIPQITASLKRIDEVLSSVNIIEEKNITVEDDNSNSVEFKNVSFSYSEDSLPAVKNISFKVETNQTLAFIGGTGCGKSTIAKLLLRFYDIDKGEVLVNGQNIKDYQLQDLREKIAFVPQKSQLFSMSIAENIAFGKKINLDRVKQVAEIACASEFIEMKEDKYNYLIEEKGVDLSGGQKQRLQIARALYKNSGILFFDDSFSALDYKTDAKLRKNLKESRKDAAILIVAQRISTIMHADKIIVLDGGEIVGEGNHEFLMKTCKVYQEIAMSQIQEENYEKE